MPRSSRASDKSPFSPLLHLFHQARQVATIKGCPQRARSGDGGTACKEPRGPFPPSEAEGESGSGTKAIAGESEGGASPSPCHGGRSSGA
eukprot:160967-Alexandrium_andersonii.AAC.1